MKWTAILIALSATLTQANPLKTEPLAARDFDGEVSCGGDLPAQRDSISDGIDYLNGVGGTPAQDPNSCGRVSCSYNSAIYMCNDNDETQYLASFATLASGAQKILDECSSGMDVVGTVKAPNGWGVQVKYASC
ncbi:uncharacterized protein BJX67DRAFT_85278 [Aspergillus lucknowensis]|uniref:Uncharacterized protein n=1 Tax=Aspergillus lucknowensis TaxID=176173 RepID=A0ABR4LSC8_9EURO